MGWTSSADMRQQVTLRFLRKRVAMHTNAFAGGQLCLDLRVLKEHRIVAWLGMFAAMREARAISGPGFLRIAGLERYAFAADRHQEHIAKVAVPGA